MSLTDNKTKIQALIAGINALPEAGATVQRRTGSFTTDSGGNVTVNCGFRPDLVVFYTCGNYTSGVPIWAAIAFEASGEERLCVTHGPSVGNYSRHVMGETDSTRTSNGFSIYMRDLSTSLAYSNAANATFAYTAIKYT